MAYPKGNMYHEGGEQIIENVEILNSTVNGVTVLTSATVPTTLSAPTGALCVCLLAGNIGLYQNVGTLAIPNWKVFGEE